MTTTGWDPAANQPVKEQTMADNLTPEALRLFTCRGCGHPFERPYLGGRPPVACSADCRRADERARYRTYRTRVAQRAPRSFAAALDLSDVDGAFLQRFWSKVDRRGPGECWPWKRYRNNRGYGQFAIRKYVMVTASRVALALASGPLAAGVVACHTCDNPPCCNPAHLFAGTQGDNVDDSVTKGRATRSHGEQHLDHRLTVEMVRIIRSTPIRYGTKTQLAREFGVSLTSIRRVLAGATWAGVR